MSQSVTHCTGVDSEPLAAAKDAAEEGVRRGAAPAACLGTCSCRRRFGAGTSTAGGTSSMGEVVDEAELVSATESGESRLREEGGPPGSRSLPPARGRPAEDGGTGWEGAARPEHGLATRFRRFGSSESAGVAREGGDRRCGPAGEGVDRLAD